MNSYMGEETYVLMFPDGSYMAGFSSEDAAWFYTPFHEPGNRQSLEEKGYAVGKCFVFIPENK